MTKSLPEGYKELTIGCDPEFLLRDKSTKKIVSAHDIVVGTKLDPHWFDDELGTMQADGTAVEIGIRPAKTAVEFNNNVNVTLANVSKYLDDQYDFVFLNHHTFEEDYFNKLPPIATEVGCAPDFNIYTQNMNERPVLPPRTVFMGGHVHVGFRDAEFIHNPDLVKLEDKTLLINIEACTSYYNLSTNAVRSAVYNSSYRSKPYGVEYRTLSNHWLRVTDKKPLFDAVENAFNRSVDSSTRRKYLVKTGTSAFECRHTI